MQHVRGKHKTPPGIQVERDAVRFKALEAELREEQARKKGKPAEKETKARSVMEPIGYCAYCHKPLFHERSWRWFYDEDGQRVRKCKYEDYCRKVRKETGQEDSYRRAVVKFNRPGREKWVDFERESEDGRDE